LGQDLEVTDGTGHNSNKLASSELPQLEWLRGSVRILPPFCSKGPCDCHGWSRPNRFRRISDVPPSGRCGGSCPTSCVGQIVLSRGTFGFLIYYSPQTLSFTGPSHYCPIATIHSRLMHPKKLSPIWGTLPKVLTKLLAKLPMATPCDCHGWSRPNRFRRISDVPPSGRCGGSCPTSCVGQIVLSRGIDSYLQIELDRTGVYPRTASCRVLSSH
jgi:hypothetical protein